MSRETFWAHPPQNDVPLKLLRNFQLYKYQAFGLMKMHNMSKI